MDPVIIAAALAASFALMALLMWRRAAALEDKVRELEAALAASKALAQAEPVEVPLERAAPSTSKSPEAPESLEAAPDAEPPKDETPKDETPKDEAPEPEAPEPEAPAPSAPEAPAPSPEPDRLRLAALKVVSDAFELARYLDFDAIVEKPSTYRVTVPITAANGEAVRYLEDGMFSCLSQVRIEDDSAILHIDTGKGPP